MHNLLYTTSSTFTLPLIIATYSPTHNSKVMFCLIFFISTILQYTDLNPNVNIITTLT